MTDLLGIPLLEMSAKKIFGCFVHTDIQRLQPVSANGRDNSHVHVPRFKGLQATVGVLCLKSVEDNKSWVASNQFNLLFLSM